METGIRQIRGLASVRKNILISWYWFIIARISLHYARNQSEHVKQYSLTYKHGKRDIVHNIIHYLRFPEKQCFPLQFPPGFAEQRLNSFSDYNDADGVEPGDFVNLTCPLVSSTQIDNSHNWHIGWYQFLTIPHIITQGTWVHWQRQRHSARLCEGDLRGDTGARYPRSAEYGLVQSWRQFALACQEHDAK